MFAALTAAQVYATGQAYAFYDSSLIIRGHSLGFRYQCALYALVCYKVHTMSPRFVPLVFGQIIFACIILNQC